MHENDPKMEPELHPQLIKNQLKIELDILMDFGRPRATPGGTPAGSNNVTPSVWRWFLGPYQQLETRYKVLDTRPEQIARYQILDSSDC